MRAARVHQESQPAREYNNGVKQEYFQRAQTATVHEKVMRRKLRNQ
jgi:hypothetical protein